MMYVLIVIIGTAGRLDATPAIAMTDFNTQSACMAAASVIKDVHSNPKRYTLIHCAPKG